MSNREGMLSPADGRQGPHPLGAPGGGRLLHPAHPDRRSDQAAVEEDRRRRTLLSNLPPFAVFVRSIPSAWRTSRTGDAIPIDTPRRALVASRRFGAGVSLDPKNRPTTKAPRHQGDRRKSTRGEDRECQDRTVPIGRMRVIPFGAGSLPLLVAPVSLR